MATSLCSDTTQLTETDINSIYGTITNQGILSDALASATRDQQTGMLTEDSLNQYIKTLQSNGTIPVPPQGNIAGQKNDKKLDEYVKKDKQFVDNLRTEYCFYNSRYKFALQKLISALGDSYSQTDANIQARVKGYLQSTQKLNQKLNDLIQISNAITKMRLKQVNDNTSSIGQLNAELSKQSAKLANQSKTLNSQQATVLLNKEMIKYTEEKNRSTKNLLNLYSVLNVVALSVLLYIYRSSGES
jgi:hypothetical protein